MTADARDAAARGTAPTAWRTNAFVAVATIVANVLGYGFNLVMSRALGPSRFGELSALIAIVLVASVPGTALQALVARQIATHDGDGGDDGQILHQSLLLGGLVGVLTLAAAPVLRLFLHVDSWASLVWLAAVLVPTTVAFGCQGVLQGRQRFHALGALLVLVQGARLVASVITAALHGGVTMSLAATAVLTCLVVLVAVPMIAHPHWHRPAIAALPLLARDAAAVLGVLVLTNLDLLLARHYLPHDEAGLYAAGNLITKAAFWGPSFVATVTYPRLTQPDSRPRALRLGATVLGALSLFGIACAAFGAPLVPVVIGHAYKPIAGDAWLFAVEGSALAIVLFGVYAGLAIRDRRLSMLVWLVAAAETIAIVLWWHGSVLQILTVVVTGSLVLVGLAIVLEGPSLRRADRLTYPAGAAGHGPGT